ncbi:MAG: hypothetical protein QM778_35660 [Myxococcales bacterium]
MTLGLSAGAAGCAKDVWVYGAKREKLSVGGEVYRVFCKRQAKAEYPKEITGLPFEDACENGDVDSLPEQYQDSDRFKAILSRRDTIVKAVNRVLGDDEVKSEKVIVQLQGDEITDFLKELLPLYDGDDPILPGNTRAIAAVLARLIDDGDTTGKKALQAFSEITGRTGYRKLDLALGLIKVVLTYPDLDKLSETGMHFLARGGKGELELDEIAQGLALEMASYDDSPLAEDSTLRIARDLMLSSVYDPVLDKDELPTAAPIWVTKRDSRGVAVPLMENGALPSVFEDSDGDGLPDTDTSGKFKGGAPTPYKLLGEKGVDRDDDDRALNGGQTLYDYFDANLTMTAAFLQEDARLSTPYPTDKDRTPFEKIGRGLPALFGLSKKHTVTYGKSKVEFDGPDPDTGAIHDLVHGVGALLKHPDETRRLLEALRIGMREHEHEMTQLVDTMLQMNELGKDFPDAQTLGETDGMPGGAHRFWDDLIAVAERMSRRKGMIERVIKMIIDDKSVQQDAIFQTWMSFKDVAKYKNADFTPAGADGLFSDEQEADLNAEATVTYKTPVDYTMPDVGENRSVWQRTMSLIHNLRNQKQCNKDGATLHLIKNLGGITLPLSGGYKPCELFEVPDMVRIYSQACMGKAAISLKPDISILGSANGLIQEDESQITGFTDKPTGPSLARFLFAPPNQFVKGLTDGVNGIDGVPITWVEPYALFAMEVKHKNAGGLSFQEAGLPLMAAFEDTELSTEIDGQCFLGCKSYKLPDGYMFADLLNVFHMHWGARSDAECQAPTAKNWTTCTQHTDPMGKFFSYQTNLRSYEPLLAKIFGELKFIHSLNVASKALESVKVDGKSGLTILAEFVEVMVKPDAELTYRDGSASAKNNVGVDVGYVSPLYLILDGLKRIDQNFAALDGGTEAQQDWHQARSDVVDLFLTIDKTDPNANRLKDRVGHKVFLRTLTFLQERIKAHQDAGDVPEWAAGLSERSVTFFDTPLIAGLVHLVDKSWQEPAAGKELMRLIVHLVDQEQNPDGFRNTIVAATDLFQLLEDTGRIAPILKLSGEAVAPGVSKAVEKGDGKADANASILRKGVELLNQVMILHTQRPTTLSKVLKNLVADTPEGKTPLEQLLDMSTEIERENPALKSTEPLKRDDFKQIATTAHNFLSSDFNGLERLFAVIKNRNVKLADSPVPPPASDDEMKQEKP